nr:ATP-binding protein [Oculatella sp. LEGE 06141]
MIGAIVGISTFSSTRIQQAEDEAQEETNLIIEHVRHLKVVSRDQIAAIKDSLLLDDQRADLSRYQAAFSEFSAELAELEELMPQSPELVSVRQHHESFQRLVTESIQPHISTLTFASSSRDIAIVQQDFKVLNSFNEAVDAHLNTLIGRLEQQNFESLEAEEQSRQKEKSVMYLVTGTIFLVLGGQFALILLPVIRSIQTLQLGAAAIGSGNLSYRLHLQTGDEIEQLCHEFNRMAGKLAQSYDSVVERSHELAETNQALTVEVREREQAETELLKAQQLLQLVIDTIPQLIVWKDRNLVFLGCNRNFALSVGLSSPADIVGKTHHDLTQNLEADRAEAGDLQIMESARPKYHVVESHTQADGTLSWVDASKIPLHDAEQNVVGILSTYEDITERIEAEETLRRSEAELQEKTQQLEQTLHELKETQIQLIQTEKMSSLGQLVAGVAHEINNPVNFISGNLTHASEYTQALLALVRLYQEHCPHPPASLQAEIDRIDLDFLIEDLPQTLSSMKVGTDRIRQIVISLRNFSRLDEAEVKSVNIHEGIDSTLLILQSRLKARADHPGIEVIKTYGHLPLIDCYAGQLNQVFMNVISNAIDALESDSKRQAAGSHTCCITIRTETLSSEAVIIRIADNGPGMSESVRKRLFDPFFTTKPVGKGTGLGLSISYQIITEKHQGAIWCESKPGEGTEFWIKLPIWQLN